MTKKPAVVISLGGSLIAPENIDTTYLLRFRDFIKRNLNKFRFIIVTGGGKTARQYQEAADKLHIKDSESLDWVGLYSSRLNAQLVRVIFGRLAEEEISVDPTVKAIFRRPVLIGAGYKPGWSTDFVAASLAVEYGASRVINLTNISHVYDRDPKKFKNAKSLRKLAWIEYQKIVGTKWRPGLNLPFDPVASGLARVSGLDVCIIYGRKFSEIQKAIEGKKFNGTVIGD